MCYMQLNSLTNTVSNTCNLVSCIILMIPKTVYKSCRCFSVSASLLTTTTTTAATTTGGSVVVGMWEFVFGRTICTGEDESCDDGEGEQCSPEDYNRMVCKTAVDVTSSAIFRHWFPFSHHFYPVCVGWGDPHGFLSFFFSWLLIFFIWLVLGWIVLPIISL